MFGFLFNGGGGVGGEVGAVADEPAAGVGVSCEGSGTGAAAGAAGAAAGGATVEAAGATVDATVREDTGGRVGGVGNGCGSSVTVADVANDFAKHWQFVEERTLMVVINVVCKVHVFCFW